MRRADYVVVALALALLPLLYSNYWGDSSPGEAIRVLDGSGKETIMPLNADRRIEVKGPIGASVIEIHNGAVRFASSPCRGQFCVHAGWLRNGNDFTACLPNRVSVAVVGGAGGFDSINF